MAKQRASNMAVMIPPEPHQGIPGGHDEGIPPTFGTARPASPDGPVPRVIDQLERAPDGVIRFKVCCRNYTPQKTRYILAHDEAEAKACYLEVNGLRKHVDKLRALGAKPEEAQEPELVVTELLD